MKILIVTHHYPPEVTPRAFRAHSLVEGFKSLGCDVEVVTRPESTLSAGIPNSRGLGLNSMQRLRVALGRGVKFFFPGGKELKYFPYYLAKLRGKKVDLVISVGLPFMTHLVVATLACLGTFNRTRLIFDYGDPYSFNPAGGFCFYGKVVEGLALRFCDLVMVPTPLMASEFKIQFPQAKVAVVPQGVDLKGFTTVDYKKNKIPTFAYAGILYKNLRFPRGFFEYLCELESDFRFIVYTDVNNSETMGLLEPYLSRLKGKLVVIGPLNRDECVYELSKKDFLINFENLNSIQSPSKLIDYGLAKRPYLSISMKQLDFSCFESFLVGDYLGFRLKDLDEFDQTLIAKKVMDMAG